ncbi:TonB-dependent receptor [Lysobacter sp. S4-A87]|uniref:TonB-dependent receptor plug domain-containing protein n=1 Tax=Lysobacter sp. S4-A87 TaxID=2925843 RepID=UPI0031F2EE24
MEHRNLRTAVRVGMLPAGIAIALAPAIAGAQESSDKGATTLDRIEVTGSRIKRADIETSQPIFSLSREDISAQGLTSIGDVIQRISAGGSTLNSSYNNGGNGETRVSLRNLGSSRTLVLVNGKRWVGGTGLGGAVDLNTIPTAAVERIEVLKDGASTIYGSDAIAGVVNVILRQDFDGAEANAYLGQYDKGDGERQSYDFTIGSSGDRWNAMLGVGYVKEEPVFAGDREISAVPFFGATPGTGNSSTSPAGRFGILGSNNGNAAPVRPDGTPGFLVATGTGAGDWRPFGTSDSYNFAPDNYLRTPQERTSLFASGSLDLTDNVRFKVATTYNERESSQLLAAGPLVLGRSNPGSLSENIVISSNNIYNPYGSDLSYIQRRATETNGRLFRQDVDTFAFNGNLEGEFEAGKNLFSWEAGYLYGENNQKDTETGLFDVRALRHGLGPSFRDGNGVARCGAPGAEIAGCVPLNFLGANTLTKEMLEYASFTGISSFGYELKNYYANIGGELFPLQGGKAAFSFGAEHRSESGFDQPDPITASSNSTGNNRTATAGGYSVDEAYLELSLPLLADLPGARLLELNVATRYSDYSTFGDTLNSKFGFKWKPIDDLLVRGNYSEGFRAPSIQELYSGVSDTFEQVADPCAGVVGGTAQRPPASCAGVPAYDQANSQIRTTVGGNAHLGPETSTSKTLGFVYSPSFVEGLGLALDWWNVEIDDAIFSQTAQEVLDRCYRANDASACALQTRASDGQISNLLVTSLNVGTYEVEGFDFNVSYQLPETKFGKFGIDWDSTYLTKYYVDVNGDGEVTDDPVSGEGGNRVGEYRNRDNQWRIRSNLATNWAYGDYGLTANLRYYSSQTESCASLPVSSTQIPLLCSDPGRITAAGARPENRIPSVTYTDVSGYVNVPWNARITLGINNIFDRDPPRSASTSANSYDPQYEVPGQFVYMRYAQKF